MSPSGLLPTLDPAIDEQAQASVLKTLLATTQHFGSGYTVSDTLKLYSMMNHAVTIQ